MDEDQLHVVFGTGQVGSALATHLASLGMAVRAVSRHRPPALAGVDWRPADVTDPEAAADAAKGASVVYQCVNAPYTEWPERFPPLQRGVLAAAERNGALLVSLENLYGYGPTGGRPMTEDLPLAATTAKGRTRAAMTGELLAAAEHGRVRIAIGRASDFFGPGVTQGSTLGERVFGNALAGRRADFIGDPDLPHSYSYVPDIAAGLATLGTDARAAGSVAPARPGDRHDPGAARPGRRRGRHSLRRCPSWPCAPSDWSTRCCGNWPRCPTGSRTSCSRHCGRWPRPSAYAPTTIAGTAGSEEQAEATLNNGCRTRQQELATLPSVTVGRCAGPFEAVEDQVEPEPELVAVVIARPQDVLDRQLGEVGVLLGREVIEEGHGHRGGFFGGAEGQVELLHREAVQVAVDGREGMSG